MRTNLNEQAGSTCSCPKLGVTVGCAAPSFAASLFLSHRTALPVICTAGLQFGQYEDQCTAQADVARCLLIDRHVQRATEAFQAGWEPDQVGWGPMGLWG